MGGSNLDPLAYPFPSAAIISFAALVLDVPVHVHALLFWPTISCVSFSGTTAYLFLLFLLVTDFFSKGK